MTVPDFLTEEELDELDEIEKAATPGPWFVRNLDDTAAMNLVAISTVPDTGHVDRWPEFDHGEIVAATLVQKPRYVDCIDGRWDENAYFIATARNKIPLLIAEIRRLRQQLAIDPQNDQEGKS